MTLEEHHHTIGQLKKLTTWCQIVLTSAKCDISCWRWHHSSLVTVPTGEVYFSAPLLSLACECHISPRVTTDVLGHTLQKWCLSEDDRWKTHKTFMDKTRKKVIYCTELPGYFCKDAISLKLQSCSGNVKKKRRVILTWHFEIQYFWLLVWC